MGAVAVWLMTVVAVASSSVNAAGTAVPAAPSVLVWELEAGDGVAPALTAAMGAELVLALRDTGSFARVLAQSDVADLVARTPGPLRDDCVGCVLALEAALKVDRVVVGRLRRVGPQMSLELKLLDVHHARVVAATHELLMDDAPLLVKGMRTRAARLLMEETRHALQDALDAALDASEVAAQNAPEKAPLDVAVDGVADENTDARTHPAPDPAAPAAPATPAQPPATAPPQEHQRVTRE